MFKNINDFSKIKPLIEELQGQWHEVAREGLDIIKNQQTTPWHEKFLYEGRWDVYGLFWEGKSVEKKSQAPFTKEILSSWVPWLMNAGFSILRPGVHIKPHQGYTNEVWRLHLGLSVPSQEKEQCAIRVGDETRCWKEGDFILFDDTIEHEAWNKTDQTRLILLMDLQTKGFLC